ncbi:MAG: methylenetetrahydrofolate--tRNA-(uracil(54)-C(5))-methyltransferase (FADH(2)-oxidizing) TrmFO [Deltaproteobacteria bacterium]|nr:methylenetetrahydrofolate--tRNA-(uracil(54)-C(5))-methyltransferase (FADH(2)-oxidizing) TrmFO [Deltaproteobacteria bacterium]
MAVVGGGLAGCEAASVLSKNGASVTLFEMKPVRFSAAHKNPDLGELVCSNSLKSARADRPQGVLKDEMRLLGSLVVDAAERSALPGGEALVVDRAKFAAALTKSIEAFEGLEVVRYEVTDLREMLDGFDFVVLATGPLTSDALAANLAGLTGEAGLHFYDAISPIVSAASVDFSRAFRASRHGRGGDDYVNCPLSEDEYHALRLAILDAVKVEPRPFEEARYFEACLPIEIIAARGEMALAYGPLSPAGLRDPVTGRRPFCVLQLRLENAEGSAFSLVAFQTRMTQGEQQRALKMVPALRNAEILRYGSIHRNTFVDAPAQLSADLSLRKEPRLFLAGVLTGVEGYCESAASGILAGLFAAARIRGVAIPQPPPTACLGALHRHVKGDLVPGRKKRPYQPMNMNRGLFPEFQERVPKAKAPEVLHQRALGDMKEWIESLRGAGLLLPIR